MALELNLTLNTNDSIEGVKGKYYPRVEYKGTMSTLQLAKHMAEHTTSFTSKTKQLIKSLTGSDASDDGGETTNSGDGSNTNYAN